MFRQSLYSDNTEGDDNVLHDFGGEGRASHRGAQSAGMECETKTLHMCHPHAHVAPCPSLSCGRACGPPLVGSVGAPGWVRGRVSSRSAWGCCLGCGLYGDGTLCMACDVGSHGGERIRVPVISLFICVWYAVLKLEEEQSHRRWVLGSR